MKKNWLGRIACFSAAVWIFSLAFLAVACNEVDMKKSRNDFELREMSTEMHYFKDANTGLCFAAMNLSMQSATMTNVPCTPEVEKIARSFTSEK